MRLYQATIQDSRFALTNYYVVARSLDAALKFATAQWDGHLVVAINFVSHNVWIAGKT